MEARDRIKRGEDRPFLPRRQVRKVLAGADDAIVDLDGVLVIVAIFPNARASKNPWHLVPHNANAGLKLIPILRVDFGTLS